MGYRRSLGLILAMGLLLSPAAARELGAQATAASSLSGSVVDGLDDPVVNAVVTLWMGDRDTGREAATDRSGRFTVDGLLPGRYDLRVEALGFHPRVVRGITVRPGGRASIAVRLREGRPPVTQVDTVSAGGSGPEGQRWLEDLELRAPSSSMEIREALELVTTMDARMGALGLPSGFTTTTVQGIPYRSTAVAPGLQDPASALSGGSAGLVRIAPLGPSSGFGLGAGGEVEVFNPSLPAGELEVFGAYSWSALWTGRYDVPQGTTPSSFWGGVRTSFDLVPDAARVLVGADVQHLERPREALFPGTTAAGGAGVEDAEVVSAFALMDWDLGDGSRVDFGARLGARPAANSIHPLAYPDAQSGLKARDIILGGGILSRIGRASGLSIRAGFTRSERSGTEAWPVSADAPFLYDVRRAYQTGVAPLSQGEGSRQGIFGSVSLRHETGAHALEGGLELLRSTHEIRPLSADILWAGAGDPFSDGWQGMATGYRDVAGPEPFSVSNLAVFARDTWDAAPGLRVLLGARWHRERLPVEDLRLDQDWAELTGLAVVTPASDADGFAGHAGLDWLAGGGAVRVTANVGATVDEIDPWILAEALATDGQAQFQRTLSGSGGFDAWPAFPAGGGISRSLPTLTLLPESMDLPASAYASLGISTERQGWSFGVSGMFRRTENLLRRADLNRASAPSGVTDAGLPVWGSLVQVGSLVTESPGSSRRFQEYDHVWAVLQDGWSQYAGLTVFSERRPANGIQLAAWYTISTTTDNLPGLGSGRAELATAGTVSGADDWSEGTSDLDIPHRVGVSAAIPFPVLAGGVLRGRFRFDSGRPFTPGLRGGVDLDADGVAGNEPVYVPAQGLDGLDARWTCVADQRGSFVERNSCRLPNVPYLDLGVSLGLVEVAGAVVSLQVDALNILQAFDTQTDHALFLVDPATGLRPDGTALSPVLRLNPGMGGEIYDTRDGRMIRIGVRWGGGE
ncbi:MAG TPA: carboxypeptidase-like regulatory domain-containing protein [Longimicrobiales bacterium]|nr:carboxypeptidase-like regulatory domain-containing protein [Longimicrobiales bacterium]